MDVKSLEQRIEENCCAIENIVLGQKNALVWQMDIATTTNNVFKFYCTGGKCLIEISVWSSVAAVGNLKIDEVSNAVGKNFVCYELNLKRGNHKIEFISQNTIVGGKVEVIGYAARKI